MKASIACGQVTHDIVLKRGAIALPHHDTVSERLLSSLGGPLPSCQSLHAAWGDPHPSLFELLGPGLENPDPPVRALRAEVAACSTSDATRAARAVLALSIWHMAAPVRRRIGLGLLRRLARSSDDLSPLERAVRARVEEAPLNADTAKELERRWTITVRRSLTEPTWERDHLGRRAIAVDEHWLWTAWAAHGASLGGCLVLRCSSRAVLTLAVVGRRPAAVEHELVRGKWVQVGVRELPQQRVAVRATGLLGERHRPVIM